MQPPGTVDDPLLTTSEAARLLGASRQHVVDLCTRGALAFESVGRHRRIRRSDVLAFRRHGEGPALTRDQRRSLWLHHAVAGRLVTDPEGVLARARTNLARLRATHPRGQAALVLARWAELLDGPVEAVLEALTSQGLAGVELRQNSPFAGVLDEPERASVLAAFARRPAHA